jgi:hypothetical protein
MNTSAKQVGEDLAFARLKSLVNEVYKDFLQKNAVLAADFGVNYDKLVGESAKRLKFLLNDGITYFGISTSTISRRLNNVRDSKSPGRISVASLENLLKISRRLN